MKKMINQIQNVLSDLKYVFLSISGWIVAHIPEWIAHLADWFVISAQVCGGLAAAFGLFKLIDQFLHKRLGIDVFRNVSKHSTGK